MIHVLTLKYKPGYCNDL